MPIQSKCPANQPFNQQDKPITNLNQPAQSPQPLIQHNLNLFESETSLRALLSGRGGRLVGWLVSRLVRHDFLIGEELRFNAPIGALVIHLFKLIFFTTLFRRQKSISVNIHTAT